MIHICDLICKELSHEKVNSGFVYGLRLAFPDEKIKIYADKSHIDTIVSILKNDGITINNLEYCPVSVSSQLNLFYYPKYYFLIKNIFSNVVTSGGNKIFFLSFNNVILHIIKKLKCHSSFSSFKFALVLHGNFEQIAGPVNAPELLPVPASSLTKRLKRYSLSSWPEKAMQLVMRRLLGAYQNKVTSLYENFFTLRELLFLHHSIDYKYIALSTHIADNAKKYIDVEKLNIDVVTMPTIFRASDKIEHNPYPKFAIFGYGNSAMLHQILTGLSKLNLSDPYEIRNIGMNNAGIEGFSNVTTTSTGKRLTRSEMEVYARDIDIFLILHPGNTYQLCCSASIFEALSYEKPILHFDNDCINTYNTKEMPIGICAGSIEEFVNNMAKIIGNYNGFLSTRDSYISNIKKTREIYSIEKSKGDVVRSFSWPHENERLN
jgi:hypothetical protein